MNQVATSLSASAVPALAVIKWWNAHPLECKDHCERHIQKELTDDNPTQIQACHFHAEVA